MTLPRQRLLGQRYTLRETLGIGGMAEVFLGNDTRLGRDVAVKVLRADLARDPTSHQRFQREAQSAAALNAPCIVSVYDTGEDVVDGARGVPWIVMEYVEGQTLRDVLQSAGRLPVRRALEIVADVCTALEVAHRAGIVHRDIKPANVMLTPSGEVKVMDFGIARALAGGSQEMTQTAQVIGTAAYLSPEQARGMQVDARSDLYSTGCLLYQLLTGRPPFCGDSPIAVAYQHVQEDPAPPSRWNGSVPDNVDAVVLKALAKDPADRYQSAAALRSDLLRAARGEPVRATPLPRPAPTVLPVDSGRSRRRTLLTALVALLLLAGVLAVGLALQAVLPDRVDRVATPAVTGLSSAEAQRRIAEDGLTTGRVDRRSTDQPAGIVLEQFPGGGMLVDQGGAVDLVVSEGPALTLVPAVVGRSRAEAEVLLEQDQLTLGRVVERTDDAPRGQVLEVVPAAGTQLAVGEQVSLVVSNGLVDVPVVVGAPRRQAVQRLEQAGFNVELRFVPDVGPAGLVLRQQPAGTGARRGSTVALTVSTTVRRPAASPSATRAPTASPSPTSAPRRSPTPTPSRSPSPLPSSTSLAPPSPDATATPPPSATPTATPTPSTSPTATPTPTPSTSSPSPSPS